MAEEEVTDLTEEGENPDAAKADPKKKLTKEEKKALKEKEREEKAAAKAAAKEAKAAKKKGGKGDEETEGEENPEAAEDTGDSEDSKKKKKKDKSPKSPREKRERQRSGGSSVAPVMIIVTLMLIGSIACALYFDVFSARALTADFIREPLLGIIVWLDPDFSNVNDELLDEAQARSNRLDAREQRIEEREEAMEQWENRVEARETQLNRRTNELNTLEAELRALYARAVPLYRRDMTQQELEDMEAIALIYTRMSPESAATILTEVYPAISDIASILYYMDARRSAAILEAFAAINPEIAAEITNVWLYS